MYNARLFMYSEDGLRRVLGGVIVTLHVVEAPPRELFCDVVLFNPLTASLTCL